MTLCHLCGESTTYDMSHMTCNYRDDVVTHLNSNCALHGQCTLKGKAIAVDVLLPEYNVQIHKVCLYMSIGADNFPSSLLHL